MKKKKEKDDEYLEKKAKELGIDPDWYDTKREFYCVMNHYLNAESGRKRRASAKQEQNRRTRYKTIETKSDESNSPIYKPDRKMWN